MSKGKLIRKTIRVDKRRVSEYFKTKQQADEWYKAMKARKALEKHGIKTVASAVPTFMEYAAQWLEERRKEYPLSTTTGEESSLRLHLLPELGQLRMNQITVGRLRQVILSASMEDKNGKVKRLGLSMRKKLKALASQIFTSARDAEPPLVEHNIAHDIVLKTSRKKQASPPKGLTLSDDCLQFIRNGRKHSDVAFVYANLMLMLGLRKAELIGTQWYQVDWRERTLTVSHIIEQASMSRVERTKSGEGSQRVLGIPDELFDVLVWWQKRSRYKAPADFILPREDGRFIGPRDITRMHNELLDGLTKRVTPHQLRHTFANQFVANSGPLKALQKILGHSSYQTTEQYARMADNQAHRFKNTVTFSIDENDDGDFDVTTMSPQNLKDDVRH